VNGEPFRGFESHPLRHTFEGKSKKVKGKRKPYFQVARLSDEAFVLTFAFLLFPFSLLMFLTNEIRNACARALVLGLFTSVIAICPLSGAANAQKRRPPAKHPAVCGNPNVTCPSAVKFEPNDLPFRIPANAVIYDTELFYAVILRSVSTRGDNCDNYIPEPERLAAQILFPDHKVFTSRCAEPGQVSYTNTNSNTNFMAVYGGTTLAEANRILAAVKATGKFPGANLRRMRAVINGT
jgi:hypothetical protein